MSQYSSSFKAIDNKGRVRFDVLKSVHKPHSPKWLYNTRAEIHWLRYALIQLFEHFSRIPLLKTSLQAILHSFVDADIKRLKWPALWDGTTTKRML